MSHFNLRPVSDKDGSSSPSGSTSTASTRTPPPNSIRDSKQLPGLPPPQPLPPTRPRRPLSPSSLRELDLTRDLNAPPRKWPAPPTGHELMALFPPAPPVSVMTGPTSDYFQREERAFFAKAGKEIVRVRIELDMPREGDPEIHKQQLRSRPDHSAMPRHWSATAPNSQSTHSPPQPQPSPTDHLPPASFQPPSSARQGPRTGPVTVTTQPLFPINSQHPSPQPPFPPNPAPGGPQQLQQQQQQQQQQQSHPGLILRTPSSHDHDHARLPPGVNLNPHESIPDEYREDPDEAWRHPMPHNQRRRAGKHTRRVVVKS